LLRGQQDRATLGLGFFDGALLALALAVHTTSSPSPVRVLLVDLSEHERHELREQLLGAGFEVMIALNHADVCLRLLTWRPDGVVADGDFPVAELGDLADVIRTSAPVPVAVLFLCSSLPDQKVRAALLLKPVAFPELLSTLRTSLRARDEARQTGWNTPSDG
jgi:CheY-like chemotaxis protein